MSSLTLGFAGTPAFGLPCLNAIYHSTHQLKAIYTQPDRPCGRGQKTSVSPIKQWAIDKNIPLYQPLHFKSEDTLQTLKSLDLDILIVVAYGLILPKKVLEIPRFGCINVHASLLPKWRGASPIQHSILHGDHRSGITLMKMTPGMDTGPMLTQIEVSLTPAETSASLHEKLSQMAAPPLITLLNEISQHPDRLTHAIEQDQQVVSYAPKIKKEEAEIKWDQPAALIDQIIRAYYPWPIAFTSYNNTPLRIYRAEPVVITHQQPPGTVLSLENQTVLIAAQTDAIRLLEVQVSGGRRLAIQDWLNANQNLTPGMLFK